MHPLFALLATRPHLLVEHALAYAALIDQELGVTYSEWRRQTVLRAVAVGCVAVAWVLGSVALMLWAATPPAQIHAPWALLVMPLLPLAAAALCLLVARTSDRSQSFTRLAQQLESDLSLLRAASSP